MAQRISIIRGRERATRMDSGGVWMLQKMSETKCGKGLKFLITDDQ